MAIVPSCPSGGCCITNYHDTVTAYRSAFRYAQKANSELRDGDDQREPHYYDFPTIANQLGGTCSVPNRIGTSFSHPQQQSLQVYDHEIPSSHLLVCASDASDANDDNANYKVFFGGLGQDPTRIQCNGRRRNLLSGY